MTEIDYTYFQFVNLPDEKRVELQELYLVQKPFDVDCMNWKWGDVKWVQDTLMSDCTYSDILEVARKESKKLNEHSSANVVFNMFNSIKKSIEAITKIEGESLAYQQTAKEMAASDAVGGFARFGTLPQTLSMVGVIAGSVREVEDYEWSTVFNAMVYKHTEGLYQKQLYK